MATTDQKKRLLKAKIAVALRDELVLQPDFVIAGVSVLTRSSHRSMIMGCEDR